MKSLTSQFTAHGSQLRLLSPQPTLSDRLFPRRTAFSNTGRAELLHLSSTSTAANQKHAVVQLRCVLANRLSEDAHESVLLLEAGPKDMLARQRITGYYTPCRKPHMDDRVMYWPRGRTEGAQGWELPTLSCPYFRRPQCHELGEDPYCPMTLLERSAGYRGGDRTPCDVSKGKPTTRSHQALLEAGQPGRLPIHPGHETDCSRKAWLDGHDHS
ncbi:hypothetical protein CRUP_009723 [Coryphaenoides rupestris]|nr:hypothetical protein CRUP_009723 [Coryphaenoides rupestris]